MIFFEIMVFSEVVVHASPLAGESSSDSHAPHLMLVATGSRRSRP